MARDTVSAVGNSYKDNFAFTFSLSMTKRVYQQNPNGNDLDFEDAVLNTSTVSRIIWIFYLF